MRIYLTAFLSLFATFTLSAESVSIGGSDLLAASVQAPLQEVAKTDNISLKIDMMGSMSAIKELKSDKIDMAVVAVIRGTESSLDGIKLIPLCYQGAVVIVNPVNSLREISMEQLKSIFCKSSKQKADQWQNMGIKNMHSIQAATTGLHDNLVVELFKNKAFAGFNLGEWVNIIDNKSDLKRFVENNNSTIAIVGKPMEGTKTIPVSATNADGGKLYSVLPSCESMHNNDYVMNLPFYIAFKPKNAKKVKAFAKALLNDSTAKEIDRNGFYPVPENFRKNFIFELDTIK